MTTPEYTHTWSDHERYTYDKCIANATDGHREPLGAPMQQLCRRRARIEYAARVAHEASERGVTVLGNGFK